VLGALRHSPGLVGYSVAGNVRDQEYYTLAVWDSEAALEAFVQGPVHRHAMTALRGRLAATRFVRWTMPGLPIPPEWTAALAHLGAPP
jgi:heme-degrading monooxygenase HmoA